MSCAVATDKLTASMLAVPGGERDGDVQVTHATQETLTAQHKMHVRSPKAHDQTLK
jgi:hypothetical protein